MESIADIVRAELATAESRITERIAALLGGLSAKGPAVPPARFHGRVRARLSPEDVASGRKRVLDAVKAGAATAGEIQRATSLDRHRVTYVVNLLRGEGKIRRRGTGRRAKYYA